MALSAILLLCLFCIFVFIYERHVYQNARMDITCHADVVSESLRHMDPGGPAAYLHLACRSHNYAYLVIRNIQGELFQRTEGVPPGPLDHLLLYLHLIPRVILTSDIVHGDQVIGNIKALWYDNTVYVELLVLLCLVLIYAVTHLYISLIRSKQALEFRVAMRTEAITEINDFLQEEIKNHRKARKALEKSEARYRTYFEDNIAGAYISTPAGELIACNQEYNKIFGFENSKEAITYTIAKTYKDPRDRTIFLDLLRKKKKESPGMKPDIRKRTAQSSICWKMLPACLMKRAT